MFDRFSFLDTFRAFSNGIITNSFFIIYYEELRQKQARKFPENFAKNKAAFKNHLVAIKYHKGFIEDVYNYNDMFYGVKYLSNSGGSLVAVYNALNYLTKKDIDLPLIINSFENDGIIYDGKLGTSLKAVDDYFQKKGMTYEFKYNANESTEMDLDFHSKNILI